MRVFHRAIVVLALTWFGGGSAGCVQPIEAASTVEFGPKPAILGRWQAADPEAAGRVGVVEAVAPIVANAGRASVVPAASPSPIVSVAGTGMAGTGFVNPVAARGGMGGSIPSLAGTGASGMAAAGSGGRGGASATGAAGADANTSVVTSLAFDVTTLSQGGRYQPRNIGAIWIQDASGRFIKSLEVWAGIRSRYLAKYNAARTGGAVDAVASATLSSHRAHHASWSLTDRNGAAVPPGKYTLFVELTDADVTGKFTSIDFDIALGPQVLNPPDAQYYTHMKLQLQ